VIPTNHNVPERDFADPERWDQNPVDKKLRRAMLRRAARVHVLFPAFADWFPADVRRKVIAIPNYVAPELDDMVLPPPSAPGGDGGGPAGQGRELPHPRRRVGGPRARLPRLAGRDLR